MPAIRFKRCYSNNKPADAALGEPILIIDTGELYIGQGTGIPLKKISDGNGIEDQNSGHEFKLWIGSEDQYNAIKNIDPYTMYFVN